MTTIIEQAREVWQAKHERLTREDWVLIGDALIAGRAWCSENDGYGGPKGFGKWCKENGFDGIDRHVRAAIIWVCERDDERDRYLLDTGYPKNRESPHRFYQDRLDDLRSEDRRSQGQRVLDLVVAQPGISSIEISEQTGIRSNTVGARLRDMEKNGALARVVDEDDKTLGWKPRAPDEPKTQPVDKTKADTVEGQLKAEAKSAGVSVPELLLRKVAENMYWLNVMLARDLNGGTTTTVQTSLEQQAESFAAWAESFHEASGRTAVKTRKTTSSVSVSVKPFNAAPVFVNLQVGVGSDEA